MSNMSYCRFRNTASDLADCAEAFGEMLEGNAEKLNREELHAAKRLARSCADILELLADAAGDDVDEMLSRIDGVEDAVEGLNEEAQEIES